MLASLHLDARGGRPLGTFGAAALSKMGEARFSANALRRHERKSTAMLKHVAAITSALGLTLVLLAPAADAGKYDYYRLNGDNAEWTKKVRFVAAAGLNSSGIINFLTFRDGSSQSGWSWQLAASYNLEHPFFVEGGLMGWTLGREDQDAVKKFGIAASAGARFNATEVGAGFMPNGGRVFVRHFFQGRTDGKGTMGQVELAFPAASGARSFLGASLGYGF
jgi:hypothetical protein